MNRWRTLAYALAPAPSARIVSWITYKEGGPEPPDGAAPRPPGSVQSAEEALGLVLQVLAGEAGSAAVGRRERSHGAGAELRPSQVGEGEDRERVQSDFRIAVGLNANVGDELRGRPTGRPAGIGLGQVLHQAPTTSRDDASG